MRKLAIIGSGDLGQLIAHHAVADRQFTLAGFFDDYRKRGDVVGAGTVLGGVGDVCAAYQEGVFDRLMIGVGYRHPEFRRTCFDEFSATIPFATLIHSSCSVDSSARVEAGAFLLPGCTLDSGVVVEANALLNTGCTIAHDSRIRRHSFLGPGVVVAGFVDIGEGAFIGVGTTIIDNIRIAAGVQTGGGAVVAKHLDEPGLYVGVPARKLR